MNNLANDRHERQLELGTVPKCNCGSGLERFPLNDAHGIFCAYVCDKCEEKVKSKYRPETFTDSTVYNGNENAFGERLEPEW